MLTLPFAFANDVLTVYAEGAKAYWGAWGPLGQPAVQAVETWTRLQRRYLEAWEAIVMPTTFNAPQMPRTATQELIRDLFTGFGVGFED